MSKYIDKDKVLEYIIFGVVGKDITCEELTRAIESLPTIEVDEDCISRQEAIKAICRECVHREHDECSIDCLEAEILRKLPSVEPINLQPTCNQLATDCISRRAAIEALDRIGSLDTEADREYARDIFENIPSVTPTVSEDCVSRQSVLDLLRDWVYECEYDEIAGLVGNLPPVEPLKKVVAQIKVDTDEIVKRIKEEYEIKDLPVCEDAISRQDTVNALCQKCGLEHKCGGADCNENWCPDVRVVMNMPPVETKRLPQPHKCVVYRDGGECRYPIEACSECPKHEGMGAVLAERPKGEWVLECDAEGYGDNLYRCSECGQKYGCQEYDLANFCPECGADMRGDEE